MTTYSAFFSSGLLAPHHVSYANYMAMSSNAASPYYDADAPSPASPSSPLPDSDIEVDTEREITPTPHPPPHGNGSTTTTSSQPRPRLRKRRSSLTVATSPMNNIRSPARSAGAALQLQMHLPSPSRSRSGSLSAAPKTDAYGMVGISNVASEGTSLVGRMRSGSVGTALRLPRRGVRRLASVPAAAPPPTAPLPALPTLFLSPAQSFFAPHSAPINGTFPADAVQCIPLNVPLTNAYSDTRPPLTVRSLSAESVTQTAFTQGVKGRDRSFSLSSTLTIDEEMKEN